MLNKLLAIEREMAIQQNDSIFHWNYFLALESDLSHLSRFVDFTEDNFDTYSIEIARLLQSACSEVDVLAYKLCLHLEPSKKASKINQYRSVLRRSISDLETTVVEIPRYGLSLTPWNNWQSDDTPDWWTDHNKVKHNRSEYFERANLKNVLNASAGLLILIICFYQLTTETRVLNPSPSLLIPDRNFAPIELILGCGTGLVLGKE